MAYKDGFKVGYEMSKIEIPSMSAELAQYQKSIDQKKLLKAQGKAAEAATREGIIEAKSKNMTFFTTGFDDTGISDYDALADKVINTFDNASAMNNWKFRNGEMSKEEYERDQNKLIRAFGGINSVYENINSKATGQEALSKEGKDNIVNTFKAELIELYGNRISFDYENGEVKMNTIGPNGQEISAFPTLLKSLTTNDVGADIDSAVDDLLKEKGYSEYLSEDGSKKFLDYSLNDENVLDLVSRKVNAFNENQVIDAAFKLGLYSTDPNDKDAEYMDFLSWTTIDKKKMDEIKGSVKIAMAEHTREMFDLKFGSRTQKLDKPEETLLPTAVQGATVEPADINKTFFQAQEGKLYKAITNYGNPFAEGTSEEVKNKYAEFNPDLVELVTVKDADGWDSVEKNRDKPKKRLQLIPKDKLNINAINVPVAFDSKEIMGLGISSSSDKQWDNIDGFVVIKRKRARVIDKVEEPNEYSIRLRGSVLDYEGKLKEASKTAKTGQGTEFSAQVQEQSFKRTDDISAPIKDSELGRVWSIYIEKNKELSAAYQKILRRAQAENPSIRLNDPKVSRELIGQTIEQFFLK